MFKNTVITMIINFLSRMLGLLREILIASIFGSTFKTDAFFTATRISNFFTTILGEGSLGTVFIPLYNEKLEKEGKNKADDFVYKIVNFISSFTITTSLLMIFFSKYIIKYLIKFNDLKTITLASNLLKITAGYLIFIALSGIFASLLNTYKKFIISTSTAIIFNLTIIIGMLLLTKRLNIYGLAIAYLFSGIFQALWQLPHVLKHISLKNFTLRVRDPYVKRFLILMVPTLVGIFAYQINELIDTSFAASLLSGTISSLNYASRVYLLPIGVFGISLSVVIFPTLSKAVVKNEHKLVKDTLNKGMKMLALLIIPCSFGIFYYSYELVRLAFFYGSFTQQSAIMTSQILKTYSLGLLFFSTIHLLTRSHYVYQNRKIPLYSSLIAIFINVLLDYLLIGPYKHVGLTLATVISSFVNFIILYISVNRWFIKINTTEYIWFLIKITLYSSICLYVSHFIKNTNRFNILLNILIFIIIYFSIILLEIKIKRIRIKDYV